MKPKRTKPRAFSVSFVTKGPLPCVEDDEALTKEAVKSAVEDAFWGCLVEGLEIHREPELE